MQVACEHCGRVYESKLTRSGGLDRCSKCDKLNVFLPNGEMNYVIFGDYIIHEKIGQGGNAYVVKGKHLASNNIIAMKLFYNKPEDEKNPEEFISEIDGASQLVHENIVRIYGGGEKDGVLFIAMEYVDGLNLAEYLDFYGPMPAEDAMAVAIHICYALDYVWSNFLMIHRDVKPQNIMITREGNVKLCDFGLVSDHEMAVVDDDQVLGTPYYVSPEMVGDSDYQDNRSDLYSLGATLYHIISGQLPFSSGNLNEILTARVENPPPKLDFVVTRLPDGLSQVVEVLMAVDPDGRYVTSTEAAEDLLLVRDGGRPRLVDDSRVRSNEG